MDSLYPHTRSRDFDDLVTRMHPINLILMLPRKPGHLVFGLQIEVKCLCLNPPLMMRNHINQIVNARQSTRVNVQL